MDLRGIVSSQNTFDMSSIVRMYTIQNSNLEVIRGWNGHRMEQRWFYPSQGSFEIKLIKIDDWDTPNSNLSALTYLLEASDNLTLHVPCGYANRIKATNKNSKLIVFSDYGIDNAVNDDYKYPVDYFKNL